MLYINEYLALSYLEKLVSYFYQYYAHIFTCMYSCVQMHKSQIETKTCVQGPRTGRLVALNDVWNIYMNEIYFFITLVPQRLMYFLNICYTFFHICFHTLYIKYYFIFFWKYFFVLAEKYFWNWCLSFTAQWPLNREHR